MPRKHSISDALIKKYCGIATVATAALLLAGNAAWAASDEQFVARSSLTLPGGKNITAFDISFDDPVIGLYLLADRTNATVQAVDTYTNTLLTPYSATPPFAGNTGNNDTLVPMG